MGKQPSYDGSGLVNLVGEIETRMSGSASVPRLRQPFGIPDGETFVLVLFDGLGVAQLEHKAADVFRRSMAGSLDAPFPTTTSVALATVATGQTPAQHGQIGHLTWFPDLGQVVNSLKWVNLSGEPVPYGYSEVLGRPNLWERLRTAGVEPITVQPGDFQTSPLTRVLYRGARFEAAWDASDLANATVSLAGEPGRFIFTYVPYVDFAGHVYGQASDEFGEAMSLAASIWEEIVSRIPPGVTVVGTADHGLMEVSEEDKLLIRDPAFDELRFAGDTRAVYLWGDAGVIGDLAALVDGELADPLTLLGPNPSDATLSRVGEQVLLAPRGRVVLPRGFDKRLKGYHGGLSEEELKIPLLVG